MCLRRTWVPSLKTQRGQGTKGEGHSFPVIHIGYKGGGRGVDCQCKLYIKLSLPGKTSTPNPISPLGLPPLQPHGFPPCTSD